MLRIAQKLRDITITTLDCYSKMLPLHPVMVVLREGHLPALGCTSSAAATQLSTRANLLISVQNCYFITKVAESS